MHKRRNDKTSVSKDKEHAMGAKVGKPQYTVGSKKSSNSNIEGWREEQLSRLADHIMETAANEIIEKAYVDVFENKDEDEFNEGEEQDNIVHEEVNGRLETIQMTS